MEFGTGCVKVTPCHDPNDFEMGQRHNLEQILVFNEDATVNANGGKYEGMDRYECRKAVVKDLEERRLPRQDRGPTSTTSAPATAAATTVEPMTSAQWFVKMAPLAKPAMRRCQRGQDQVCARPLLQDLSALDGERTRLVHLPSAVVGSPHSGVLLRRLR